MWITVFLKWNCRVAPMKPSVSSLTATPCPPRKAGSWPTVPPLIRSKSLRKPAAIHYINDNYGLDYHGTKLGVEYSHDFMGPLLVSPTYLESQDDKLRVAVNVRAPKAETSLEELAKTIKQKLVNYA